MDRNSSKNETCCVSIKAVHDVHQLGINRTHYLAKLEDPGVTRDHVADVTTRVPNVSL